MNFTVRSQAGPRIAVTHVIVMCADNNNLIFQLRIVAGDHSQDIAIIRRERLLEAVFVSGRTKIELGKLFDQIIARCPATARARLSAFHLHVGQAI